MRRALLALAALAALAAGAQQAPLPATLRVTADPPATLWVNHEEVGADRAFTLELTPGEPTVLRVSAPGYEPQWRAVTLGPGERGLEQFTLARSPIPVLFRAEGEVTVLCEGAELGVTPCHAFFDEPRAYRVLLRAPGFQERVLRLDLANGKPRVVDASLVSSTGAIAVSSQPPGARLLLNGVPQGQTPLTLEGLRTGEHTLTLRLEGHKPFTHTLTLGPGETARLDLPLERLPAGLTVSTLPQGARVYVDGVFRGESDLTIPGLPAGAHTLRVERPGYARAERALTLEAGATRVEEFRLEVVRGTLSVQTQPGEVEVWAGNKRLLTTEPGPDGFTSKPAALSLPPGRHALTLKARGYADLARTVAVEAGKTATLRAQLVFKPDFEVRTATRTYTGVFTKRTPEGGFTLELKPGTFRTFLPSEIRSSRFLEGALE